MNNQEYIIRNALPHEFEEIGKLMTEVYSSLEGFPAETEEPAYYKTFSNIGDFINQPQTELLVAVSNDDKIAGAVVYFGDIQYYNTGGIATKQKSAAGFRFLAVYNWARGKGIGKLLTNVCIEKSVNKRRFQVIIHTTKAMLTAWKMYEDLGFERSEDLDFTFGEITVYGFKLNLLEDNFYE